MLWMGGAVGRPVDLVHEGAHCLLLGGRHRIAAIAAGGSVARVRRG